MKNLDLLLTNIEKFKQTNALTEAYHTDGCIFEPLKYKNNNYGFMLVSEEKYETAVDELGSYQQKHRYYYYEKFKDGGNDVVIIMFNPSKANPFKDDPTIKNCRRIIEENYSSMEIINIFSERNPNVKDLENADNSLNIKFVTKLLEERANSAIVLAWGQKKIPQEWQKIIMKLSTNEKIKILTKEGAKIQIRHPGNQGWSRLRGLNGVKLTNLNDLKGKLEDLILFDYSE